MASKKNKVTVRISNSDKLDANFAGGNIGSKLGSAEDMSNEVNADLQDVTNSKLQVGGADISTHDQTLEPLIRQLVEILVEHLPEKGQRQDLQEIAEEVLVQAAKPAEEKNIPKLQRLLNSLGGYIGVATLAVTQAERIKVLFENIQKLIMGQ